MPSDVNVETGAYRGFINKQADARVKKARKIEAILSRRVDLAQSDVLDLGAGSGLLAAYFKPLVRSIAAADREPDAFEPTDISIAKTATSDLPFSDASFDVIIFNHVIEHVGERDDQARMLAEIRRILRPGGLLYLAVPNRWTLVEPHYRLPFLSWLPRSIADLWLRALNRNTWYDCRPFGHRELLKFIRESGFQTEDVTREAFYDLISLEKPNHVLGHIPQPVVSALIWLMPTFVVLGR